MPINHRAIRHLFAIVGVVFTIGLAQAQSQGVEAGKVLMSLGDVKVTRGGKTIPLKKGDGVQAGDIIVTGPTSNAQVRMSDGAIMAIRAQTEIGRAHV